jgi:lactoylglutathione lyase
MRMTAPLEVGICCRDLDRLLAFYVDVLGCSHINTLEVPPAKSRPAGLAGDGYRVARLQTPWGERMKLLQPATPPSPAAAPNWLLDRQGATYVTFIVDDLDAMLERLEAAEVATITGWTKIEVRPGTWLAFVRDPEGNVLEFVAYADVAAYRPDLAAR